MKLIHVLLPGKDMQDRGALISLDMIKHYGVVTDTDKILRVGDVRFRGDLQSFYRFIVDTWGMDATHDIEDIGVYFSNFP